MASERHILLPGPAVSAATGKLFISAGGMPSGKRRKCRAHRGEIANAGCADADLAPEREVSRTHAAAARHAGAFAKIAQPISSRAYPRIRLFRRIDKVRKQPILWISAPAGAGKTTLVASYLQARKLSAIWYHFDKGDRDVASFFYYMAMAAKRAAPRYSKALPFLTPEYFGDLDAFSSHFFGEFFARLDDHRTVVFDNYQDLPEYGRLHGLLAQGFAQIPEGTNIIVISREAPPIDFARARACQSMALIDFEEIRFTPEECVGVVRLSGRGAALSREETSRLCEETQGWVAGLVLLRESVRGDGPLPSDRSRAADSSLFDYFASEVFRHADARTCGFLLQTAFLPKFSITMAQALASSTNAGPILDYLVRHNLFTVQHVDGSYEYHALFRAFLAARARTEIVPEQLAALKRRSAELLAEDGDIENAVALLQDAEDWEGALELVLSNASALLAQGRTQTVETWLRAIPETLWHTNAWALYWFAVCRMFFTPVEARGYFERAFELFEKNRDSSPLYLAWSGIMESLALDRDDFTLTHKWLDMYESLAVGRAPPTPEIEAASVFVYLSGLIASRFDDPNLETYAERAESLLEQKTPDQWRPAHALILVSYFIWKGEDAKVRRLLDVLDPIVHATDAKPIVRLQWCMWKLLNTSGSGNRESLQRVIKEFVALSEESGVHLLDLQAMGYAVWGLVCTGDISDAHLLLERMSRLDRSGKVKEAFFNHFASIVHMQEGDIPLALEEACIAAEKSKACGLSLGEVSYRIGLAYILARHGDLDAASAAIAEARPKVLRMRSKLFTFHLLLCEANIYRLRGEREQCLHVLRDAIGFSENMNVVTSAYCPRDDAALLYLIALQNNISPRYVRSLIERSRLILPGGSYTEYWPWPLRLYTLGRFGIEKDGMLLRFTGRAHKKPLELLRALIAFGGREVALSKLAEALWPDTEADVAQTALETTLHRLRKLLGERAILTRERRLTLNAECCWVDCFALKQLTEQDTSMSSLERLERLLALYRGPFLEGEEAAWVLVERDRLRGKFLRAVLALCECVDAEGGGESVIAFYEKAIDTDPFAAELYLRLIERHRRANRRLDALATYRRYETIFCSVLNVEPSAQARALRAQIESEAAQGV